MTFYRDIIENNSKTWVNAYYVGRKQGTRLTDALEYEEES